MENEEEKNLDDYINVNEADIINPKEILLLDMIKCPIEENIPLDPEMCTNCLNIFCSSCVKQWRERRKTCPICRANLDTIPVDNSIINQQINKIKLKCFYEDKGCKFTGNAKEIKDHIKICQYTPIECEYCKKFTVTSMTMYQHLLEECPANQILCFFCNKKFNLSALAEHIKSCEEEITPCQECFLLHNEEEKKNCELKYATCKDCGFLEIVKKLEDKSHICPSLNKDKDNKDLLDSEFKLLLIKNFKNELLYYLKKNEDKLTNFIKNKNNKIKNLEEIIIEKNEEILRKINVQKKLKQNRIEEKKIILKKRIMQLKEDISTLERNARLKETENKSFESFFEKSKTNFETNSKENLQISELELKISEKLLKQITKKTNKESLEKSIPVPEPLESKKAKKFFDTQFAEKCADCNEFPFDRKKCICCQKIFCKNCYKRCSNYYFHDVDEGICCKKCYEKCSTCENHFCSKCMRKCFFSGCKNKFCALCYEKNKHLIKDANFDCRIFACKTCGDDHICLMSSVSNKGQRYCKKCYFKNFDFQATKEGKKNSDYEKMLKEREMERKRLLEKKIEEFGEDAKEENS